MCIPFRLAVSLFLAAGLCAQGPADKLVVHEWGTFTVLQDERGEPLPGVNINEESLPNFVHRLAPGLAPDSHELAPLLLLGTHSKFASKGIGRSFPAARMRMETPILYFYPPKHEPELTLDVRVDFHRGWISEWYPNAKCRAPGFEGRNKPRAIPADRSGSILWNGLKIGSKKAPPKTKSKVWLAPRVKAAASVETPKGEAERYVFYRGVADLPAPLRVVREGMRLNIIEGDRPAGLSGKLRYPALWMLDVKDDGSMAFWEKGVLTSEGGKAKKTLARIPAGFDSGDYDKTNLGPLRDAMRREIQVAGLFREEADAMLKTWEVSYFHSPGLRIFFVLPREWVDKVLPLHLSRRADIARVMIGRIELIKPEQRKLARDLAKLDAASSSIWFHKELMQLPAAQRNQARQDLVTSNKTWRDLDFNVPEDYRIYLKLGRFRDAILLEEERLRPTKTLSAFVRNYRLKYFDQNERTSRARPASGSAPRRGRGNNDR